MISQKKKKLLCECGGPKDRRSMRCCECTRRVKYSPYEDKIISDNYDKFSSHDIAKLINRTHSSIRHRAVTLRLCNNKVHNSYKLCKYSTIRGTRGDKAPGWKGGRVNVRGYILIYSPDHPNKDKSGYVSEHRLVVEKKIGRFLRKEEVVHHINSIRSDNRIDSLYLSQLSFVNIISSPSEIAYQTKYLLLNKPYSLLEMDI